MMRTNDSNRRGWMSVVVPALVLIAGTVALAWQVSSTPSGVPDAAIQNARVAPEATVTPNANNDAVSVENWTLTAACRGK